MRGLVVVAEGFRSLELACVMDAIAALNAIIQPQRWTFDIVSTHGGGRRAGDGRICVETRRVAMAGRVELALVLGGADSAVAASGQVALVQRLLMSGATVCLLSETAAAMTSLGVLVRDPVCLPWDHPLVLEGTMPRSDDHDGIYHRSGRVITSAGAASTLDLVLALVAEKLGCRVAMRLADILKSAPARPATASQRCGLNEKYQTSNPVLLNALAMMETHIETPLQIRDIARHVGRSTRQLERLFLRHYGTAPKRFYEGIRARRAHWMVVYSEFPIIDVAVMCGFGCRSSFNKAFSRQFGVSPSAARRGTGRNRAGSKRPSDMGARDG